MLRRSSPSRMKMIVRILFVVLAFLLLFFAWYVFSLGAVDASDTQRVTLTIEEGWSTSRIASVLSEHNLIRSEAAFRWYVWLHGLDGTLQAGTFILQPDLSAKDIASVLRTGKASEVRITIPEGYTVSDIDALLVDAGLIEAGELIECAKTCDFSTFEFLPKVQGLADRGGKLEGYLYPDTYFASVEEFVPKFFLERLLGAFRENVLDPYEGLIETSPYSLHDIVTMASLVEEETLTDGERPIVAGILWKRLEADWGLGVDATVRYILNKPSEDITHADLNVNSPYNLRKFRGLPPGPIANAGKKSFEAVLYPSETQYWYYLHDKEGTIHYSVTNEEHNTKRYMYLGGGSEE